MNREAPFDVWDGEGLDRPESDELHAAEEVAMRVDSIDQPAWSELTTDEAVPAPVSPVRYFADEEPEGPSSWQPDDDREPDLEELLEHQHYAFPEEHRG